MSSSQIAVEFQKSRIYVGASRSDGISTSFLEAMNYGTFPIQTNTSCAQDWIAKGCIGRVVEPSFEEILNALNDVYDDLDTIRSAAKINLNVLEEETETVLIKERAKSFYR
jgi:glycosyltransferase involved in cell wall biosynthesis